MTTIVDIGDYIPVQFPTFVTRSVSGKICGPAKVFNYSDYRTIWKQAYMEKMSYTEYMNLLRYADINPRDEAAALMCQRSLVTV